MRELFLRFALLSGTGGLTILVLHLAKPLLRRVPAKWTLWLWLLTGLRMLMPLGFAMPLPAVVPEFTAPSGVVSPAPAGSAIAPEVIEAAPTVTPASSPIDWLGIFMCLWLAGAAIVLLWHIAVYLHARKTLLQGGTAIESPQLRALCEEYQLRPPLLLTSPAVHVPMAVGLLRPVIVLPAHAYPTEELECILRHELCHWKARHLPMKVLLLVMNALHWFNPTAWLLRRNAAAAMELCCDEMVLRGASTERRGVYSKALLRCAGRQRFSTALSSNWNGGTNEMKERLRNIFTAKPKKTILVTTIILLGMALAVTAAGIGPGLLRKTNAMPNSGGAPTMPAEYNQSGAAQEAQTIPGEYNQHGESKDFLPVHETHLYRYYLDGEEFTPSETFAYYPVADGGLRLYFSVEELAAILESAHHGALAKKLRQAEGLTYIGTIPCRPDDAFPIDSLSVQIGWEYSSHTPVWFRTMNTAQTMPSIDDASAPAQLLWPVPDIHSVTAGYGAQGGELHSGIDIADENAKGKEVIAAAAGYVEGTGNSERAGVYIVINHGGGLWTVYEHLEEGSVSLQFGNKVEAGQTIARVGNTGQSTGPHLHFEVLLNNQAVDPMKYLPQP